jgi:hypothetical protein
MILISSVPLQELIQNQGYLSKTLAWWWPGGLVQVTVRVSSQWWLVCAPTEFILVIPCPPPFQNPPKHQPARPIQGESELGFLDIALDSQSAGSNAPDYMDVASHLPWLHLQPFHWHGPGKSFVLIAPTAQLQPKNRLQHLLQAVAVPSTSVEALGCLSPWYTELANSSRRDMQRGHTTTAILAQPGVVTGFRAKASHFHSPQ